MTDIAGGGLVAQAARPAPGGAGEGELLMDDDHTASLLCAWREGDQSALGRLLAQNEDWMRAQVRRRIARHELHHLLIEEQEIVQEGVSELLRSPNSLPLVSKNSIEPQHRPVYELAAVPATGFRPCFSGARLRNGGSGRFGHEAPARHASPTVGQ